MASKRDRLIAAAKTNPKWSEWLRQFEGGDVPHASKGMIATDALEDALPGAIFRMLGDEGSQQSATDAGYSDEETPDAKQEFDRWLGKKNAEVAQERADALNVLLNPDGKSGPSDEQQTEADMLKFAADEAGRQAGYNRDADGEFGVLDYIAPPGEGGKPIGPILPKIGAAASAIGNAIAPAASQPLDSDLPVPQAAPQAQQSQIAPVAPQASMQATEQPVSQSDLAGIRARVRAPGYSGDAGRMGGVADLVRQQELAERAMADVASRKADALSLVKEQALEEQKAIAAEREKRLHDDRKRSDEYEKMIMNQQIDPDHFWGSKSTGMQIMISIAMALGGNKKTGKNMALDLVNNAIERDIEAQKANLGKTQSLYAKHLERSRNEDEAYQQTRADMASIVAAKMSLVATQFGGEEAQAAAQQNIGALKQRGIELQNKLANDWASRTLHLSQARATEAEIALRAASSQGVSKDGLLRVPVIKTAPDGTQDVFYTVKRTASRAADLRAREVSSNTMGFLSKLERYIELAERNSHGGVPLSRDVAEMQGLHKDMRFDYSMAQEQGVIRKEESPAYDEIVPDISKFRAGFSAAYADRLQDLRKRVEHGLANRLVPYLEVE